MPHDSRPCLFFFLVSIEIFISQENFNSGQRKGKILKIKRDNELPSHRNINMYANYTSGRERERGQPAPTTLQTPRFDANQNAH